MLKIKQGGLYRHRNTLDIDVYVVGPVFPYNYEIAFIAAYWNRHYKMIQGDKEVIKIKYKDLKNWIEVDV